MGVNMDSFTNVGLPGGKKEGPSGSVRGNHKGTGPTPPVKNQKTIGSKLTKRMALRAKMKSMNGGVGGNKATQVMTAALPD